MIATAKPTLPAIDYESHPAYRDLPAASLGDRARSSFALAPSLIRVSGGRALTVGRRWVDGMVHRKHDAGAPEVLRELRDQGCASAALLPGDLSLIIDGLDESRQRLESGLAAIPVEQRTYGDGQLVLHRETDSGVFGAIERGLQRVGVIGAASAYIGNPVRIRFLTLQINDGGEAHWHSKFADVGLADPPALYLHIDTTPRMAKCLVYLTDVGADSGPFCYVVASHEYRVGAVEALIRSAVDKSGLSARDRETRRRFASLPRFLQKKADFGTDLLPGDHGTRTLLAKEAVMTGPAGSCILFDNRGVHRGGMVTEGRRVILQVGLA